MARNSKIEWTHHTFNPWWGCVKVSAACKHCYAETWAKRVGSQVWGAKAPRRFFGENHWRQPLRWNSDAAEDGQRRRVFCASMADVGERRSDLDPWRDRLWALIEETPWLDWLLLTKRIETFGELAPWTSTWPDNVWLGTTVESNRWYRRIEALCSTSAKVLFLSCEPMLGPLELKPWLPNIHWVIAGGESGPKARPMHPRWVRDLRDQCVQSGVAFHFKQWGNWFPIGAGEEGHSRVREVVSGDDRVQLVNVGKKAAGRVLDGRTWDQVPSPAVA